MGASSSKRPMNELTSSSSFLAAAPRRIPQVVRAGRLRRAHALTRRVTHPSRRTTRDGDRTDAVGDESAHRHDVAQVWYERDSVLVR